MKYKILQLKDITKCSYSFMDSEYAQNHGFDIRDYKVVYEGEMDAEFDPEDKTDHILDHIFWKFNADHPEDFKGHSLSVSDIVQLEDTFYYCDSIGWTRLS